MGDNGIGIAVVGCGHWSTEAHLPALAADDRARLAAAVDPDSEARETARARYGDADTRLFASVEEMLSEMRPDGAVVAVPHVLHGPLAIPLARAGVHLLVEKPMVLDPAEGVALLAAAEASGTEILVGYPWHYNAQAIALRSAIAAGRIGTIELATCTYGSTVRDYYRGDTTSHLEEDGYERAPGSSTYADPAIAGGGQGQTQLTHSAALLLFLTGLRPRRVTAEVEDFELQVDLADALAVRFEGGAIGTLASTGGVVRGHEEALEYRIFGDAGHVGYDVMQGRAWIAGPQGTVERLDVLAPELRYPQLEPLRNLVDVVAGTGPNRSPGDLGQRVVELIDGMYRSASGGGIPVALAGRVAS
jgi:predicted dehydrogenase